MVRRKSWHARIYKWWYEHKYPNPIGAGKSSFDRKQRTNLCPYVRAVVFWAPLRFIFWDWVELLHWGPRYVLTLNMLTIPTLLYSVPKIVGYWSYDMKCRF
jgi:hypothetical protein